MEFNATDAVVNNLKKINTTRCESTVTWPMLPHREKGNFIKGIKYIQFGNC